MNKRDRRFQLRKETIALLATTKLERVVGGIPASNQCSGMCSEVPGSCVTCGPTWCGR
jgi:hypothetical protein